MTVDISKIEELVQSTILASLERLERDDETPLEDFYEIGLDEDGVPYSYGNADDVYSDGYNAGVVAGEYELAIRIQQMIDDQR